MTTSKQFREKAWDALRGKWSNFAVITLLYSIITSALSATGIGTILVSGPFTVAISAISLKVMRGDGIEVENLFDGFKNFMDNFMLGLVNGLYIFLWSLLFIIPGIIKSLAYSMSYYIMADNPGISYKEARERSEKMMEGHKMRLFCLHLSFIGWMILSAFTFGILLFWIQPYMNTAVAAFYEELKADEWIPKV